MGHWILEVTKIGIYIAMPLSTFIMFNSPSFYVPILYDWRKANEPFTHDEEDAIKQRRDMVRFLSNPANNPYRNATSQK